MVEDVEQVTPELQLHALRAKCKVLRRGEIVVRQTRSVILIASRRSHSTNRWRCRKVCLTECRIRVAVILRQRSASHHVGPVVELIETAEIGGAVIHRKGS